MKYVAAVLLAVLACTCNAYARDKHTKRGLPRTEAGLVDNLVGCLQNKDSTGYYNLFIPFDTLWHMVLHNSDRSPEAAAALNVLKEHPQTLLEFDPHYNRGILNRFNAIVQKGEDSGVNWRGVRLQRYELRKQSITNSRLAAYDRLAPERFQGYIFLRDLLSRTNYCVSVTEIQKINGYFYGGQIVNMLAASTVDEYMVREAEEKKYLEWLAAHPFTDTASADSSSVDSTAKKKNPLAIEIEDEDHSKVRKEVVDRKYYEGKFDDEIPVKLYVRYKKEPGIHKPVVYDGLYKFGDQQKYVRLEITRTADGKWLMEDNVPLGVLELVLEGRTFTGVWTNSDQTGFDVVCKQTGIPPRKVEALDNILDKGLSGRIDEASFTDEPPADTTGARPAADKSSAEKTKTAKTKKKRDEDDEDDEQERLKKKYDKEAERKMRKARRRENDE